MKPTTRFWLGIARMGVSLLCSAYLLFVLGSYLPYRTAPSYLLLLVGYGLVWVMFGGTFLRMGTALAGYVSIRQGVKARVREMEKTSGRDHNYSKQP